MIKRISSLTLIAGFCALPSFAFDFPKPTGYVVDAAGVLSPEQKLQLEETLSEFQKKTSHEISVAVVPTLQGESVEQFAVKLFESWGIGKKGKNNGVLLLIATQDRKTRIEVGYGLEPVLPDGLCGDIIREQLVPAFRESKYGDGISAAVDRIMKIIEGDATASTINEEEGIQGDMPLWILLPFFSIFIGLGSFALGAGFRTKTGFPIIWGSGFGGIPLLMSFAFLWNTAVLWVLPVFALFMFWLGWKLGKKGNYFSSSGGARSSGWSMGSSGGGFGGGGSSFGGFGGGSSGGGGASGSW